MFPFRQLNEIEVYAGMEKSHLNWASYPKIKRKSHINRPPLLQIKSAKLVVETITMQNSLFLLTTY